ncbi:MAG: gamma-glutamyl-gamma-aminobutyrate hydrolase family protein [Cyanobacteria bacterium P01_A01_bin.84]
MTSRLSTLNKKNSNEKLPFSNATGGRFESRPFVVQSKSDNSKQPDLQTSLMQADTYGHHFYKTDLANESATAAVQPKFDNQPIQLGVDKGQGKANLGLSKELDDIKKQNVVSNLLKHKSKEKPPDINSINVGVSFRTDGRGTAHKGHDLKAVEAMNQIEGMKGLQVNSTTLPRNASGEDTPERKANFKELDDIDLLYIPGAPNANKTQVGDNEKDKMLNVPKAPPKPPEFLGQKELSKKQGNKLAEYEKSKEKYDKTKDARKYNERESRSNYEQKLIEVAKTRGIPISAVCAGSWELLQSYGGEVKTIPEGDRDIHKASKSNDTWKIGHKVDVKGGSMLSGMMNKEGQKQDINDVNSTHWASPHRKGEKLVKRDNQEKDRDQDPNKMLDISATAPAKTNTWFEGKASNKQQQESTVEAFESKFGAPTLGIQWHPESYLPGMLGEEQGSEEARKGSQAIFKGMAEAALTSKRKKAVVKELESMNRKRKASQ